jgi:hypothetical protein
MKNTAPLTFLILVLILPAFGQTKKSLRNTKPSAPKEKSQEEVKPKQKVTVELVNGDRVSGLFVSGDVKSVTLLVANSNLTFELSEMTVLRFVDETVKSSEIASANTTALPSAQPVQAPPAEETSLSFQAAIVYKMNGAQPVARAPFALLDRSVEDILRDAGVKPEKNFNYATSLGFAMKYPSQYAGFSAAAAEALKSHIITTTTSDFEGRGQFRNLKKGSYWIFCYSQTRGGFAVWNLSVNLPDGPSNIILDQNNAAVSF